MTFTEILDQYHVPYQAEGGHHHARRGWIQMDCPWCGQGSNAWHLGYSLVKGNANCWRCGRKGVADVLAALCRITWQEAKAKLGPLARYAVPSKPPGRLVLPNYRGPLLPGHIHYLRDLRGYDVDELVRLWELEGIGPAPALQWRIFIPIHYRDKVVSWTTRSINPDATLRYHSASEEQEARPHKQLLYGEDYCRNSVIVHEGPPDVWRTGPGAVATCGTSYTAEQILAISRYPIRAICFDNEPEAQRRARYLADQLMHYPGTTANVVLDAHDAGEADEAEIAALRAEFLT